MTEGRYDKHYTYGKAEFYLSDYMPDIEQSRFLILKVLEQAVRDYISLGHSQVPNERALFETAKGFLFDDNYTVNWGDKELTTEELLGMVDLNITWVREQTTKKLNERK